MIGLLTHNFGWKVLSLVLAVLLWVAFVRDPELSTIVTAPVLFRGMPADMELSGELIDRVQLEVRGPSGQLAPEDLAGAAVVLDLGNVDRPGDRTYNIKETNVSLPRGVLFSRAVPGQIRLHFELRVSRIVPVRIRYSNLPPDGYQIARSVVEPERLPIVGPKRNVEEVEFAVTDSIDLSGVVGETEFRVNAYLSDPRVRFESSPEVTVRVNVEKNP